jgi:uncharacterized membrane protein YraQ (UPF0718 family)
MLSLVASILILLLGPILYSLLRRRDSMLSLMDGLIFTTMTGLVVFVLLPESFDQGGWPTLIFAVIGLFGPSFLESIARQQARRTHVIALVLGFSGLVIHAALDGTALSGMLGTGSTGPVLPLAVVLHQLPVGLTIWWLLRPSFGLGVAVAAMAAMSASTVAGYMGGEWLTRGLSGESLAWFQALVAGSLAHVVFHQPHLKQDTCGCKEVTAAANRYEGAGALMGVGLLALVAAGHLAHDGGETAGGSLQVFLTLALESAPALLLAYLMAGALHAFLPYSSIVWMRRGSAFSQSIRGMAVGLPFPVCSCGVVPLYQSLIRKGAPATAAMSFLIATPELGLDAVILSIPLLGIEMAAIRVAGAAVVAVLVGWIVGRICDRSTGSSLLGDQPVSAAAPLGGKVKKTFQVGFGEVVDHTAPWILLGIAVAALVQPHLTSGWLRRLPDFWEVPLFTLIGLPAYVCASGATPLVAVLLAGGLSPGAALAFLLTGPATNVSTFGLLGRLHGQRTAFIFSGTIIAVSMALGFLVNWWFPASGAGALNPTLHEEAGPLQIISLLLLTVVFLASLFRRGARKFVAELLFQDQRAIDLHPHYH